MNSLLVSKLDKILGDKDAVANIAVKSLKVAKKFYEDSTVLLSVPVITNIGLDIFLCLPQILLQLAAIQYSAILNCCFIVLWKTRNKPLAVE